METKQHCNPYVQLVGDVGPRGVQMLLLRDDPSHLEGLSEVDVLVKPSDAETLTELSVSHGWELLDAGIFHPFKRSLVKYSEGRLYKFDVHLALIDGAVIYDEWRDYFDSASQHETGFLVPHEAIWLRHVLLHIMLAKNEIPIKYVARLSTTPALRNNLRLKHWIPEIEELLNLVAGDPLTHLNSRSAIASIRSRLRNRLRFTKNNLLRGVYFSLIWKIGVILGWRMGVLISVIGPDGAGKTTFNKTLSEALGALEIPTRTFYFGPWEQPYLYSSKFLTKLGASPLDEHIEHALNTKRPSKIVKAYLKWVIY